VATSAKQGSLPTSGDDRPFLVLVEREGATRYLTVSR
jgi:hypothetical protein